MSQQGLHSLLGTAAIDRGFCRWLLDNPLEAAAAFDLTPEELAAVASIRANTIMQFAAQVQQWILQTYGDPHAQLDLRPRALRNQPAL